MRENHWPPACRDQKEGMPESSSQANGVGRGLTFELVRASAGRKFVAFDLRCGELKGLM
jgi:hypothetical protein